MGAAPVSPSEACPGVDSGTMVSVIGNSVQCYSPPVMASTLPPDAIPAYVVDGSYDDGQVCVLLYFAFFLQVGVDEFLGCLFILFRATALSRPGFKSQTSAGTTSVRQPLDRSTSNFPTPGCWRR